MNVTILGLYRTFLADAQNYPQNLNPLIRLLEHTLTYLDPSQVETSPEQGFDLAGSIACKNAKIPYTLNVPFPRYEQVWNDEDKHLFYLYQGHAARVEYYSDRLPDNEDGDRRGRAIQLKESMMRGMVDRSDLLITLWSPSMTKNFSTRLVVEYAESINKRMLNLWEMYQLKLFSTKVR
ncbi:hypothetical protein [Chroococcidiopsis sp.]|uniref:hypothetical protein n=1 Tax=Chroococcidiopsis sp. TaxID=3088168 RepID=UPI003F39993B